MIIYLQQRALLEETLQKEQKRIIPIAADGNCLFRFVFSIIILIHDPFCTFRSIATGLGLSQEESVMKVRLLAVAELESHKEQYEEFVVGMTWDSMLDDLRQDHHWAGQLALKAIVNNLGVRIIVHQIGRNPIVHEPESLGEQMKTIELAYLANSHYDLITTTHPEILSKKAPSISSELEKIDLPLLLEAILTSEEETVKWIVDQQLIPPTLDCPICHRTLKHSPASSGGKLGSYFCWHCDKRWYAHSGGFLHGLRLAIHTILKICLGWLEGKEKRMIQREVGVSFRAVIHLTNRLNVLSSILFAKSTFKLGGSNRIVEIDEANMPRSKYHVGRIKEECWVLGLIERPIQKEELPPVILVSLPDRSSDTLMRLIRKFVLPGTLILTDGWSSYQALDDSEFKHEFVNHSLNFVAPETEAHTQRVESLWRWVRRRGLPITGCTPATIDYYLASFNYRRSIRGDYLQFFRDLFSITYAELSEELLKQQKVLSTYRIAQIEKHEVATALTSASPIIDDPDPSMIEIQEEPSGPDIASSPNSDGEKALTSVDLCHMTRFTSQKSLPITALIDEVPCRVPSRAEDFNVSEHAVETIKKRTQKQIEKMVKSEREKQRKLQLSRVRTRSTSRPNTRSHSSTKKS